MDADLDFCLGQFFNDQHQIIDCYLEAIKQQEFQAEIIKHHEHELLRQRERLRDEGEKLIEQLIRELRDNEEAIRNNNKAISGIIWQILYPVRNPALERDSIVRKFAEDLLRLDEEKRKKMSSDEIFNQLNSLSIDQIIDYAKEWLRKHDQILKQEVNEYNARLKAIEADLNRKKNATEAEKLGIRECGLQIQNILMDPIWNKVYVWGKTDVQQEVYWPGSINRGNKPYYCPSGWKRYGIKVAKDAQEFNAKWGNWHVAYHGTADKNASKILATGLKVSRNGCFYEPGVPRIYVSPSIEYCAHPRYARPWKKAKINDKDRWYQLVFQCRVNPASVSYIGPETLIYDEYKKSVKVDPNFDNNKLEWVILGEQDVEFIKDDIICYGLMMRISDVDPRHLEPSAWWKHSRHTGGY